MGIANKLNSGRKQTVREGVDTKNIEYLSAAQLAETGVDFPVKIAGFFLKNGEYGEQVTLIVEDQDEFLGVNIPKRYADMFKDLSGEEIDDIIEGKLAIESITPDVKTPKGKTTMIEFCDL